MGVGDGVGWGRPTTTGTAVLAGTGTVKIAVDPLWPRAAEGLAELDDEWTGEVVAVPDGGTTGSPGLVTADPLAPDPPPSGDGDEDGREDGAGG